MRCKQYRDWRAGFGGELAPGWAEPLGEGGNEERMPRPALGKVDAQPRRLGGNRTFQGTAIEAHAGARVMRRKAENRGRFHAVCSQLPDNIGDIGMPVAHSDVNGNTLAARGQFRFHHARLFEGDFCQWAVADERVTALNLLDNLGRQRPASGHVAQVLGDLLDRLRRSVSQQENGALSH